MEKRSDSLYEQAINGFLERPKEEFELIRQHLRLLFDQQYKEQSGSTSHEHLTAIPEVFSTSLTQESKKDIDRATPSRSTIKHYIGQTLIPKLKITTDNQADRVQDRCEVIFKHVFGAYHRKLENPEEIETFNKGIDSIRNEAVFPAIKGTLHREGEEAKYRSLDDMLAGKKPASKNNLKLAFAVFNIDLETFRKNLESELEEKGISWSRKTSAALSAEPKTDRREKTNDTKPTEVHGNRWMKIAILIALLTVTSIFGVNYIKKLQNKETPIRPRVEASELFSQYFPVNPSDFYLKDTLLLKTVRVHHESLLIDKDTTAMERLMLRLSLVNLFEKGHFFVDAIFLEPLELTTLSGKRIEKQQKLRGAAGLTIVLDREQTWPYEWTVISTPSSEGFSPMSASYMTLLIEGKDNMSGTIWPFEILIKVHDTTGKSFIVASDQQYKIGFP